MSTEITTTLAEDKAVLDTVLEDAAKRKAELDRLLVAFLTGDETATEEALAAAQSAHVRLAAQSSELQTAYRTKAEASLKETRAAYDTARTKLENGVNLFKAKGEGLADLRGLKATADAAKAEYDAARKALGLDALTAGTGATARSGQGGWRGISATGNRGIANGSVAHPSASGSTGKNAYVLRLDRSGRLLRHFPNEDVWAAILHDLDARDDKNVATLVKNALEATRTTASKGRIAVYLDRTVARGILPTLVRLAATGGPVANNARRTAERVQEYLALSTDQVIAQSGATDKDADDADDDAQ